MSELPANSVDPQVVPNANEASATAFSETKSPGTVAPRESQSQFAEKLNPLEGEPVRVNSEIEQEVALPPVLQENQTSQTEVAKPVSPEYIHKGARISSLTHVALETFRDLQRKLAVHYQKMKQGTSS